MGLTYTKLIFIEHFPHEAHPGRFQMDESVPSDGPDY
jgi:hypothetical protein